MISSNPLLDVPNKLMMYSTTPQLQERLKFLKRSRKRLTWWGLNGQISVLPRTTSIMLIQERLRQRETERELR